MSSNENITKSENSDPPKDTEKAKSQRVQRGTLKGPEAKNHPDWKYKTNEARVAHPNAIERTTGPEAKNSKPWHSEDQEKTISVTKSEKSKKLKGPRAKNYKPWKKK